MDRNPEIEPHHDITVADTDWADWRLYEHNIAATGHADWKPLGFVIRNGTASVVGLAYGFSWGGIAELGKMWVHEDYRDKGYGRALLLAFVEEAKRRHVKRVWVASYDFQAPKMYEKFGFRRVAEFPGWPEGHTNVLLCKEFVEG
jgi:GNAT superfamily N-acetyltransferase